MMATRPEMSLNITSSFLKLLSRIASALAACNLKSPWNTELMRLTSPSTCAIVTSLSALTFSTHRFPVILSMSMSLTMLSRTRKAMYDPCAFACLSDTLRSPLGMDTWRISILPWPLCTRMPKLMMDAIMRTLQSPSHSETEKAPLPISRPVATTSPLHFSIFTPFEMKEPSSKSTRPFRSMTCRSPPTREADRCTSPLPPFTSKLLAMSVCWPTSISPFTLLIFSESISVALIATPPVCELASTCTSPPTIAWSMTT
mmetsp:Transcript_2986/g.7233  ORF Transcript_2986/g.7233 Transcript_2986/m.7233 type:complete len:258 (-) Transcript_2986:729-1502(-)